MSEFSNNLFEFATSELSQDAFICWVVNWINGPKENKLYQMAEDFLTGLLGCTNDELLDGVEVLKQYNRIDVLVIVKRSKKAIIIEDKTFTGEHDDQIERYKEQIKFLTKEGKVDATDIKTVYFKTGFLYDNDRIVAQKTDYTVDREKLLDVLNKYKGLNDIVDSYIEYLEWLNDWYKENGAITAENVSNHYIAQYNLMNSIFSNIDKTNPIYNGTNQGGTPWTEYTIYRGAVGELFWRIDSDNKGPYISLRFYNKHNKKNKEEHNIHVKKYEKYREIVEEILDANKFEFSKEEVLPGYRGNYYEAALLTWNIGEELELGDDSKKKVADEVSRFTKAVLNKVESL